MTKGAVLEVEAAFTLHKRATTFGKISRRPGADLGFCSGFQSFDIAQMPDIDQQPKTDPQKEISAKPCKHHDQW